MTTRDVLRLRAVYPIGLAIWGPLAGAIGIHTALWLASGLFLEALVALRGSGHSPTLGVRERKPPWHRIALWTHAGRWQRSPLP